MPAENPPKGPPDTHVAPGVVAPTNKINVALPFSQIRVQEPSRELAELAALVAELAELVEASAPGPRAEQVRDGARALARRLQ